MQVVLVFERTHGDGDMMIWFRTRQSGDRPTDQNSGDQRSNSTTEKVAPSPSQILELEREAGALKSEWALFVSLVASV